MIILVKIGITLLACSALITSLFFGIIVPFSEIPERLEWLMKISSAAALTGLTLLTIAGFMLLWL